MPSKTEEYLALAQRTANGLTRYWESWTDYLTTASRLYKYPFADQLMIYAQRPDATACADYDVWNSRMNRYVRRGSKGIALLDESSGFPRLHYVFDVSDTGVRRNSRDPEVWQYNDDLKQPVSEMLAAIYGISGERVSQQLADVAGKLVADYWDNNGEDIRAIVDGSLLMDYDEAGVEMQFKSAAAMSVLNGSLYPHLMEVEQTAESRMQQTMAQLLKQNPAPDKEQNQMAWVQHMNSLRAQAEELVLIAAPDVADAEAQRKTLPADPTVKNFSYTVVDGEIYYRENSIMTQIELSDNAKGRKSTGWRAFYSKAAGKVAQVSETETGKAARRRP